MCRNPLQTSGERKGCLTTGCCMITRCYLLQCLADLCSCLLVFISEDNSAPALQNSPAELLPKPASSPSDQEASVHFCLTRDHWVMDWRTSFCLVFIFLLPGLYELYKQQLITRVTVHSYLVLVTNNSGLGWASKTSSSLQWTRSNDINTELLVSANNIFTGNNGQVLTPLLYQYCLFYIYLGEVWCIYSRYTVAEQ